MSPLLLSLALVGQTPWTNVTAAAGVDYLHFDPVGWPPCYLGTGLCTVDWMTGGATVGDYDGDGWPDLYVTRLGRRDILFRNRADGSFEDATVAAGLTFALNTNGANFADIDNDGDADLWVTTVGESRYYLFVNQGDGTFLEDARNRDADLATGATRSGFSIAFGDYDRDGYLDAYLTEWLDLATPASTSHARLLRNLGSARPGYFEDVTAAAGVDVRGVHPGGVWGFAPAFVDLDLDGWVDLAIASDFGSTRLYWNDGDGTFTDGTSAAMIGGDENGMGSTFGDVNGDGYLDWFITAIFDPAATCQSMTCNWGFTGNRLYHYAGSRTFSDRTDAWGVRDGAWGWGASFFDWDNDTDLDLVMTTGIDFPLNDLDAAYNDDPMVLWRHDGTGTPMAEVSTPAGLSDNGQGKALVTFDYDRDGDLDLFVTNTGGRPRLWRNDLSTNNGWLRVSVLGVGSNRDGIGARIILYETLERRPQVRHIGASSHFLGESERVAHFGLGPGASAAVGLCVVWPGRGIDVRRDLVANTEMLVRESGPMVNQQPHEDTDDDGVPDECRQRLDGTWVPPDPFGPALVPHNACAAGAAPPWWVLGLLFLRWRRSLGR